VIAEFLVAQNPELGSKLPFLLRVPLAEGDIWLKAAQSWPCEGRVYCHPFQIAPDTYARLNVVDRADVLVCERRGNAIDLILSRGKNRRSQFVFVSAQGRKLIFWQTARSVRGIRPGLRVPGCESATGFTIYVDSRERYGYLFSSYSCNVERRPLRVGDYAIMHGSQVRAAVERKTLPDFFSSITSGSLGFCAAELAHVPYGAVVVESTYGSILRHAFTPRGFVATVLARLLIRYPNVAFNFIESRRAAEEWVYNYLAEACLN
jgi:hypothetical protein